MRAAPSYLQLENSLSTSADIPGQNHVQAVQDEEILTDGSSTTLNTLQPALSLAPRDNTSRIHQLKALSELAYVTGYGHEAFGFVASY